MPFFISRIEQTAHTRFQVEAEVSFPICRLLNKTYSSFDEAMLAVRAFHDQHLPRSSPHTVAGPASDSAPMVKRSPEEWFDLTDTLKNQGDPVSVRDQLFLNAVSRGIDIDRRWSEATLRTKIAEHDAAAAEPTEVHAPEDAA